MSDEGQLQDGDQRLDGGEMEVRREVALVRIRVRRHQGALPIDPPRAALTPPERLDSRRPG